MKGRPLLGKTPAAAAGEKTRPRKIVLIESMDPDRRAAGNAWLAPCCSLRARRKKRRVRVRPRPSWEPLKPASRAGTAIRITEGARPTARSTTWRSSPPPIARCRSVAGWKSKISSTARRCRFASRTAARSSEGRIIDLSRAAARQIEMIGPGIVKVRVEVIAPPETQPARELYAVQVGAFENRSNAERLEKSLREQLSFLPPCAPREFLSPVARAGGRRADRGSGRCTGARTSRGIRLRFCRALG